MAKVNLINNRYGKLLVIGRADDYYDTNGKQKDSQWTCLCDCGNQVVVRKASLISGCTKSCGCLRKYNTYDLSGEYGIGYTSKGKEFYFDLEDYEKIKDYCWLSSHDYICTSINGKLVPIYRIVLDIENESLLVDHRNHNKADNQKKNLRIVTYSQNNMNKSMQSNNTSGATGVVWYKATNRWKAQIKINGKNMHLGYFTKFDDAVKARKQAEEKYFGEYSYDNSIKEEQEVKL